MALFLFLALPMGCERESGPHVYGTEIGQAELTQSAKPLSQVLTSPGSRDVTASGTISRVCQTMGCWFYLSEGDALVLIDLEVGARFTIPVDSRGKRCVVRGRLHADGGDRRIVATSALVWP